MKRQCPDSECSAQNPSPKTRRLVRKGAYFRRSDGQWIQRFFCKNCGRTFSSATFNPCYRQKKRKLNRSLALLLDSGVSQRRAAQILRINRKTVVRKLRFLSAVAQLKHEQWLKQLSKSPLAEVQFDDLETSEH